MHVAKLFQACPTLCYPMDCSPPGPYVHGILQTSILEWIGMPFSNTTQGSNLGLDVFYVFCIGMQVLYTSAIWEAHWTMYITLKLTWLIHIFLIK